MATAKVTTYQTALKNGFSLSNLAEHLAEYGWLVKEPAARDATVQIDLYGFGDADLDDSAEGSDKIAHGQVFGSHEYTLVVAKCDCGCTWGDAIDTDENSVASHLNCPDCDREHKPSEYTLNDGLSFRRVLRGAKP